MDNSPQEQNNETKPHQEAKTPQERHCLVCLTPASQMNAVGSSNMNMNFDYCSVCKKLTDFSPYPKRKY